MDKLNILKFLGYSFKKPRMTTSNGVNSNLKILFSHDGKHFFIVKKNHCCSKEHI